MPASEIFPPETFAITPTLSAAMDSLPLSLEPRPFQGLLTGLIKKNYYGDKDITLEFLVEELYSTIEELEEGQHVSEITLYEKVRVGI